MNASSAKDITISGSSSEERYGSGTDIGPHQGGDVVKLQPMDVLLGRGKKHRTHPGNVLYTGM